MKRFIADARARNRRLRLRVLHENRIDKRFYERLGFLTLETLEHHYLMGIDPSVTDRLWPATDAQLGRSQRL